MNSNSNDQMILIVGAGISGLTAASLLADKYKTIILEGADRTGGRIHSLQLEKFPQIVEAGAEFIHGHQKETMRLLKKARIGYEAVEGAIYRKEKNKTVEEEVFIDGWDTLLKKMKSIQQDMTLYDFLQTYFAEDRYADLRRQATAYAEGFDVADVKKISVWSLYQEWSHQEDANFRIPAGYGALIDYLSDHCKQKGCDLITGDPVKQIDWEPGEATVYTASGKKYFASKVIITVSVNLLQTTGEKNSLNFTPPIDEQVRAARQIGFGTVIKLILSFREHFWGNNMSFIISDEEVPTWWTQLPRTTPILTGWIGGGKAEQMKGLTQEAILEKGLRSLSNIFNIPLEQLKNNLRSSQVVNWNDNRFTLGAYSYDTPYSKAARKLLNTPLEDTIYFCGEALYEGPATGTVEAAILSATETARRIQESHNAIL